VAAVRWLRILEGYYLATPLFLLADLYLSTPIRVAALGDSPWRWPYYAFAFGCGFVCHFRPSLAPVVGMTESSLNLFLLLLGILLPVWGLPDAFLAGEPLRGPFDQVSVVNFILSGAVFITAFHRSRRALPGGG